MKDGDAGIDPSVDARPFVSIVIATFNRREQLGPTLLAALRQDYPAARYEIIVVDNSSTDGTEEWVAAEIQRLGHRLRYVRKEPNGPGPARNLGAQLAEGEYVLFLDSDVSLEADWLTRAAAIMDDHPECGLLGGKLVYEFAPERLNSFGGAMGPLGLGWDDHEGALAADLTGRRPCLWVNSSALLARRDLFIEAGGFDEAFFHAYEEADLGWRVNLAGAAVYCDSGLLALHRVEPVPSASDPQFVFHYCKNRLRMLLKNASTFHLIVYLPLYLLYSVADIALRGPRGAKARALAWNLGTLCDTWRLRRAIHARRRTSPRVVEKLMCARWFPPAPLNKLRRRPLATTATGKPG